jgi:hypothetical protein
MREVDGQLITRCCPAVFAHLSDTAGHRRLLDQSSTRYATCGDQLIVIGDAAVEWSAMLNLTLSPLLRSGRIPASDPVCRQLISLVIDAVLPKPHDPGALCCMTVPGSGSDEAGSGHDADFFQQLVALRGYRPQIITATQALALADLNDCSFTGIVISIGHATCEFGIVHCGREINRHVVMNGLESFEGAPLLGENLISRDPVAVSSNVEREYQRFFKEAISEARNAFERDRTLKTLPQPMAVACAGAVTSAAPFRALFQRVWNESVWPVTTRPIRVGINPQLAIVRGCLIQAELDHPSLRKSA